MGFDVKAALARALEAENQNTRGSDTANSANSAKRSHQGGQSLARLASLAGNRTLHSEKPKTPDPEFDPKISASAEGSDYPFGTSPGGRPVTYTGKVVSLDAWRSLSDREKHGPGGKHWGGQSQQWEGQT
ncbi:hypothetical protein [Roseovarius aestuarii]|uniref:Uncharacterized protein n=1 Tax=Roseovarius aestuarii TaxID=475083 RepID=A0A1X7BVS3_9RHOB|nr:hypothetical protein [Roseovarius aestuarii]SMC13736.1 hypothetical protein ROA7745_03595 [Roseovarius aestuarii]